MTTSPISNARMTLRSVANFLLLRHLWRSHGPFYVCAKVFVATILIIVCDRHITRNPDSISSVFNAVLFVAPVTLRGLTTALNIYVAAIFGGVLGTIGNILIPDPITTFYRVPLALAFTYYFFCLAGKQDDVAALTSAYFSALFVQLLLLPYPPLEPVISFAHWPWVHTLIIRGLSIFTALIFVTLTNFVFSGLFYKRIFRKRIRNLQGVMPDMLLSIAQDPNPLRVSTANALLVDLLQDLDTAMIERSFLHRNADVGVLEKDKFIAHLYFKLLNLFTFMGFQRDVMSEKEVRLMDSYCHRIGLLLRQVVICPAQFKVPSSRADSLSASITPIAPNIFDVESFHILAYSMNLTLHSLVELKSKLSKDHGNLVEAIDDKIV